MDKKNTIIGVVVVVIVLAIIGWASGWFGGTAPQDADGSCHHDRTARRSSDDPEQPATPAPATPPATTPPATTTQ